MLGLVQRAIEQQERLIALTTELKKALLHKLFTEGLRGEPQKQTEIGPVPESWEVVQNVGDDSKLKRDEVCFDGTILGSTAQYDSTSRATSLRKADSSQTKLSRQMSLTWVRFRTVRVTKGDLLVPMTEQKARLLALISS